MVGAGAATCTRVGSPFRAVLHILHVVCRAEFSFVPEFMVKLDELAERISTT